MEQIVSDMWLMCVIVALMTWWWIWHQGQAVNEGARQCWSRVSDRVAQHDGTTLDLSGWWCQMCQRCCLPTSSTTIITIAAVFGNFVYSHHFIATHNNNTNNIIINWTISTHLSLCVWHKLKFTLTLALQTATSNPRTCSGWQAPFWASWCTWQSCRWAVRHCRWTHTTH